MSGRSKDFKKTQRQARAAVARSGRPSPALPEAHRLQIMEAQVDQLEATLPPEPSQPPQTSAPRDGSTKTTSGRRKFLLYVEGIIPGENLTEERQAILAATEEAITGLRDQGILLLQAGYRSDPVSALTAIAQAVPGTIAPTLDSSSSPSAPLPAGPSAASGS